MSAEVDTERSREEDILFNAERSSRLKEARDEDLMLAAEIGKSLLERNRELEIVLKATQEFAEEQCAQVDFYVKQVEILRDQNEMSSRACEQLEANNQILSDKCEQWKGDCKILEGKNARLWEVINNLETRIEELTSELDKVKEELLEKENRLEKENQDKKKTMNKTDTYIYNTIHDSGHGHLEFIPTVIKDLPSPCELENETLKKQLSELNIQNKLGKLEKGEIESQLEDLVSENQALYHKISNLNQEVTEWENFAQKEENYRRLAAAFTLKHYAEIEPDCFDAVEKRIQETLLPPTKITKAKSCECINYTTENNMGVAKVKSPNLVNNILSSVNSSSFLSELDTEYADLVKRYEALLEKFKKQEGKLNENPARTRKVQRAIQTLSMDFSMLTSPTKSVSAETSPMKDWDSKSYNMLRSPSCDSDDYRKLFADIFAKLKESSFSR